MTVEGEKKPRIVVYGVGQFGQHVIRFADKKGWPVVAAYNRAGTKVGQDIGQLAGLGKDTGVVVEDCDLADYSALDADVAIVATSGYLSVNFSAYERLMNAGVNIVCIAGEACFPYAFDKELAARIDRLARKNNVTFTGTGIWDQSRIWSGILAAGPCVDITSLYHKSITDTPRAGKDLMLATGVSLTQEQFRKQFIDKESVNKDGSVGGVYPTVLIHVLTALGYTVTTVSERLEPVLSDKPVFCKPLDKYLEPGICLGTRIVAEVETAEGVHSRADIELRIVDENEKEHMLWEVNGSPTTRIRVEREDPNHLATASSPFNRILDVMAAPPGIQEIYKLGPLKHTALQ